MPFRVGDSAASWRWKRRPSDLQTAGGSGPGESRACRRLAFHGLPGAPFGDGAGSHDVALANAEEVQGLAQRSGPSCEGCVPRRARRCTGVRLGNSGRRHGADDERPAGCRRGREGPWSVSEYRPFSPRRAARFVAGARGACLRRRTRDVAAPPFSFLGDQGIGSRTRALRRGLQLRPLPCLQVDWRARRRPGRDGLRADRLCVCRELFDGSARWPACAPVELRRRAVSEGAGRGHWRLLRPCARSARLGPGRIVARRHAPGRRRATSG